MSSIWYLVIAGVLIIFVATIELLISEGKIVRVVTPSYRPVIRVTIIAMLINVAICIVVFFCSKSAEVTLGIGAALTACIVSAFILRMFHEYQNERRLRWERDEALQRVRLKPPPRDKR